MTAGVLALAWVSMSSAFAPPGNGAIQVFQSRYDQFTKAYSAKDLKTLGSLLAPDFKTGSYARPIDKKMLLESCARSNGVFQTRTRKVLTAVMNGNKASTMVRQVTVGTFHDRKKNLKHEIVLVIVCADTWIKSPTGWQIRHMKNIHTTATQDGKPYKGHIET
ncbi:MAG: nuclear transport factor 2 family protein [Fimbriimonas sp.]|nr:nuclear transport factor 2 family protein [Fimbriimonas sp.]